nr:PREDICTED: uncharacterized protein LOC109042841 isoform X2 [Bemisia tabaci]
MALFRENDEMPELGNVLDPNNLDWYPYLSNWPCDNTSLYTFVMTDPDSPSKYKPKMREWQHWLVGNIHVAVEEGDFLPDVFESDMMSKYIPPYPKKGTGFHRIVFLVYKQPMGRIEFKEKLLSYKMSQLSISSSDDEPLIITATPLTSPSTTGAALLRAAAKLQTSTHTPPPQARQPTQPAQARLQTYKSPTRQPTRPAKITSRGPSRQHPQMSRPHPSAKPATTVFRRLGPLPTASARSSGPSVASTTTRLTRNPSGPPPAAFSPRTAARVPRAFTSKRASRASPPSTL